MNALQLFGEFFNRTRINSGRTHEEIEKSSGISRDEYLKWESGKSLPNMAMVPTYLRSYGEHTMQELSELLYFIQEQFLGVDLSPNASKKDKQQPS